MSERLRPDPVDPDPGELAEGRRIDAAWVPPRRPDEDVARARRLADEIRPLVESLNRLRERGLLD
ncbi:MAG TPA: hypothetical protein VM344_10220 [Vitreimonas sp.]|nr:hypothetical protein [Vitreimonas sp.]